MQLKNAHKDLEPRYKLKSNMGVTCAEDQALLLHSCVWNLCAAQDYFSASSNAVDNGKHTEDAWLSTAFSDS